MGQVIWGREALGWLEEIRRYIEQDNPAAARQTTLEILDRVEVLADFPELGRKYDRDPDRGVRILLYGHYRIPYRVKENRDVEIIGVFHGALDMDRYLP